MNWRKFCRSPREIHFRLRQELLNFRYFLVPPACLPLPESPLPFLPPPATIRQLLTGSTFASETIALAEQVLDHRIPILGYTLDCGPHLPWRQDSLRKISSGLEYFRKIPYLNPDQVGDHKVVWELNRHHHLVLLAQAHLLSDNPAFLAEIEAQLTDWLRENPFHCGINWTSALEVGFRALSWVWVYHLVGNRLEAPLRLQFGQSLFKHGLHLEANLSHYFSPNTHLLGEAVALHALGVLFDHARWQTKGGEVVDQQLTAQVLSDGAHFEQSTYYHVYALDFFLFHALIAGKQQPYGQVLIRMGEYLEALLGPSRKLPFIGDDDGGRLFHPYGNRAHFGRATLSTLGLVYEGKQWIHSSDCSEQAVWWLGRSCPTTEQVDEPRTLPSFRHFPQTGKAILSAGLLHILLDAAPFGPFQAGHSHAGCLSLLLRYGQEDLLIDPGTFVYVGDSRQRDWFRGIGAHNTVAVKGLEPASPNGPFGWLGRPQVWLGGTTQSSVRMEARYASLTHVRQVTVNSDGFTVEDTLEHPQDGLDAILSWVSAEPYVPLGEGKWRIGSTVIVDLPGAVVVASQRSPVYGRLEPAFTLQLSVRGPSPLQFITRFHWS